MSKALAAEATPESGIDDKGFAWRDIRVGGETYRIRQISVEESDAAFDATYNEKTDTSNPRLRSRIELCYAIVDPVTEPPMIDRWPRAKLFALLTAFDRLNNLPAADTEGNDSGPTA